MNDYRSPTSIVFTYNNNTLILEKDVIYNRILQQQPVLPLGFKKRTCAYRYVNINNNIEQQLQQPAFILLNL